VIEHKIRQLERDQAKSSKSEKQTLPLSKYSLGTWDRAASQEASDETKPLTIPTNKADSEHPPHQQPYIGGNEKDESVPQDQLSSAEIDALAKLVTDVADRIIWLRSYWAVTLSVEVECEAEAWLARLHELAAKLSLIAPDKLDEAVKGYEYLLTQAVRTIPKPQIDEKTQQRYMSPSAPNFFEAQLWFDVFYSYEPLAPRPAATGFRMACERLLGTEWRVQVFRL
jgi:hypothetical protein